MLRSLVILALLFGPGPGAKKDGRRGNALMRQDQFAEAADAYRSGLARFESAEPDGVRSGLLRNLAAALFRQDDFEGAQNAADAAYQLAPDAPAASLAAYNGGNAAFKAEELQPALDRFRQALLQDPSNANARFNYEFVKRRLQEQQDQQQNQDQQSDEQQDQENQDQQGDQNDEQQNQDQENQDPQNQDQQEQDQQQSQEQDQQPQQQDQLSQEEAQRILEALENDEEQLLRQVQKMKTRPRRVEKDW